MARRALEHPTGTEVSIQVGSETISGDLVIPLEAAGVVIFAHGSGSGRFSSRNRFVARALNAGGFGTLLLDLLTESEDRIDQLTRQHRFDIPLLSTRVIAAIDWCRRDARTRNLAIGLFGASTGAAAALIAAAVRPGEVRAVISRGGRPDLAASVVDRVKAPTLLIVGGYDVDVIRLNELAFDGLRCEKHLAIIPGATHLFEEPGTLDQVCNLASNWFAEHLAPSTIVAR